MADDGRRTTGEDEDEDEDRFGSEDGDRTGTGTVLEASIAVAVRKLSSCGATEGMVTDPLYQHFALIITLVLA